MEKPDCYKCRWRTSVPGSTHSKCLHPYNCSYDSMLELLATFASVGRVSLPPISDKRLKIKANNAGIRNGWFNYPFNFDPMWLESCNGFEEFRENDARIVNKTQGCSTCERPFFCEDCPSKFECFTNRNGINDRFICS